jgi:hypothetical protein
MNGGIALLSLGVPQWIGRVLRGNTVPIRFAGVDIDPLPKGPARFGRAQARVRGDANGIGLAQQCLLMATSS